MILGDYFLWKKLNCMKFILIKYYQNKYVKSWSKLRVGNTKLFFGSKPNISLFSFLLDKEGKKSKYFFYIKIYDILSEKVWCWWFWSNFVWSVCCVFLIYFIFILVSTFIGWCCWMGEKCAFIIYNNINVF